MARQHSQRRRKNQRGRIVNAIFVIFIAVWGCISWILIGNIQQKNAEKSDLVNSTPLVSPERRPSWCLEQPAKNETEPVYLGAVVYARIWPHTDPANLTFADLAHWMTYMRFSGVERVYLYDTYHDKMLEQTLQHPSIQAGIDSNFIVYVDWSEVEMKNIDSKTGKRSIEHMGAVQVPAYFDMQERARYKVRWMTYTDMDEYILSPSDESTGFLSRFLQRKDPIESSPYDSKHKEVRKSQTTQWLLQNILARGGRDPALGPTLIQQVPRVQTGEGDSRTKQIVFLEASMRPQVHKSTLKYGQTTTANGEDEPHSRHFWGGRDLGWKTLAQMPPEAREDLLQKTVPNDMNHIAKEILKCF